MTNHYMKNMKIRTIASALAAVLSLAAQSSAEIVMYSTPTTVSNGGSVKMNWSPGGGWSVATGQHYGSEPLYLSSALYLDYGDGPEYNQGYIGSWQGTALSLSTGFISASAVVDGGLGYSGYIDLTPVNNSTSTYAGLRYDLGGGNYNYGWVNYATNANSTEITLLGAAFNTTANEPIFAGQTSAIAAVPEPSEYLLGGVPALLGGFMLLRRRAARCAVVSV
jgi:hypothetical protein